MTPEQWVLVLGAAVAVLGGVGTIIKMLLDYQAGVRSKEADSEERHMARLEKRVQDLEATVNRLENTLRRRDSYIAALLRHIALGGEGPIPEDQPEHQNI